jgi:hypothetical protein
MSESTAMDVRGGYYSIGEFDGKERFVRFDLNAFAEMENIYGSMEKANEALSKGSMKDVRTILWLGLLHDQAELDPVTGEPIRYTLTMFQVGKWLTPMNMKQVMEKLNAAIRGSVPQDISEETTPEGMTPAQAQRLAEQEEGTQQKVFQFRAAEVSQ